MKDELQPYPEPSKTQDKIVSATEKFANALKKIKHGTGMLFYPISYIPAKLNEKKAHENWEQRQRSVPLNELIQPQQQAVYVDTRQQAMDHNFFYVLQKGRIWYKPIAAPKYSPWSLLGPDGIPPNGIKIICITTDGRNLVAIDEFGIVNYLHTDGIDYVVNDCGWKVNNINLNWTDRWFAIPIINRIVGLVRDKYLKLPENCIAIAISQKGPETGYYTDMSGKKQPEFLVGVTTLFALCADGRIFFADPWLGNGFLNEITAPEDGQFIADNMAAGASTIFLIRMDETGKAVMYTRFADFDSTGGDPLLPATYNANNRIPLVRRLPAEDWVKQPEIPLQGYARLTSNISVIQTGRGQNNRQLRVEGTNADGVPGFYYKAIYEDKWHFELTPEQRFQFINYPHTTRPPAPPVDLDGEIFTRKERTPFKEAALKKFLHHGLNERGLHTMIELTLQNGRKLSLPLYARRGFAHLFGRHNDVPNWVLVLPNEYKQDYDPEVQAALKIIFKHKNQIRVYVNEFENGDIEIFTKHGRVQFEFKEAAQNNSKTSYSPAMFNNQTAQSYHSNTELQQTMIAPARRPYK